MAEMTDRDALISPSRAFGEQLLDAHETTTRTVRQDNARPAVVWDCKCGVVFDRGSTAADDWLLHLIDVSRPRVVTDPGEVPVGAVVLRADGLVARRSAHDTAAFFGDAVHDPWSEIYGPVTVLFDPTEES